jgi:hypothetical protein
MTKFSLVALAILGIAGVSAPALAAPTEAGSVPYCSANNNSAELARQIDSLSAQLQLSTKAGSNIDVWNGCLKVMTTVDGKTTVAFYDPDSLRLVDTLGPGTTLAG